MITVSRNLAILALASASVAQGASWFAPAGGQANEPLARANQAYLRGDFAAMTTSVREVLANPATGAVERQNVFALLHKAFEVNHGHLPADWRLPAPLSNLKFKNYRKDLVDGIEFAFALDVTVPEADTITQLQLVRYPDQVVLDHQAGLGEWTVSQDDDGYEIELYGDNVREPLEEGLYLLHFGMKDGSHFDAWFPLDHLESSASPNLREPEVGQTYTQGNPEVRWDDFRSPEYQSSERRIAVVSVGQLSGPNHTWNGVWNLAVHDPTLTSTVIGTVPDASGVDHLVDGKYWLSLTYYEQRMFGDMKLRRGSRTARPFFVKTQP